MNAPRNPSRPLLRSRRSLRAGSTSALIVTIALSMGVVPSWAASRSNARSTIVSCAAQSIHVRLTTDRVHYVAGALVKVTAAIRNTSSRTCTIATGPSAPMFSVLDNHGLAVWSSCGGTVAMTACPQFLSLRTLAPGATLRVGATWDQRTGTPAHRVTPGAYHARTRFVSTTATVAFSIVAVTASRSLVITQVQNGEHLVLHLGERLIVRLGASSIYAWSAPRTSNGTTLARVVASAGASASATFLATAPGSADVTAVDTPKCYPQCLAPSRLFRVVVRVEP